MSSLLLTTKMVIFLWLINFVPPLLALIFHNKFNKPVDANKTFFDGQPILGSHKTIRGVTGAVICGGITAHLFSFTFFEGTTIAALSMLGDLITSFLKRRVKTPSGTVIPGMDQFLEAFLPIIFWKNITNISWFWVVIATILFGTGAFEGSKFFKQVILLSPSTNYPRPLNPRVRLREWKSCQVNNKLWRIFFNFEDAIFYHLLLYGILQITGTYVIGVKNALQITRRDIDLFFDDLPPNFDGFTILFMSDLHIDGHSRLSETLESVLKSLEKHDICVMAGDYRFDNVGDPMPSIWKIIELVPTINSVSREGIVAVLGNHDCIEMTHFLEQEGIKFLINECVAIKRGNQEIYLAGVDDPHYFKCDSIRDALKNVRPDSFSILVAHSPELYRQASNMRVRLYLCGHTHGGQIAFPKIGPIFTHSKTGRRFAYGLWKYKDMIGYTSSGVGSSGIFARFGTTPEVVTIRLRRKDNLRSP